MNENKLKTFKIYYLHTNVNIINIKKIVNNYLLRKFFKFVNLFQFKQFCARWNIYLDIAVISLQQLWKFIEKYVIYVNAKQKYLHMYKLCFYRTKQFCICKISTNSRRLLNSVVCYLNCDKDKQIYVCIISLLLRAKKYNKMHLMHKTISYK